MNENIETPEIVYNSPSIENESYVDVELTDIDLDNEYESVVTENIYNDQSIYDHGYSDGYAAALKALSENPTV